MKQPWNLAAWLASGLGALLAFMTCNPAIADAARPAGVSEEELFGSVIRRSKWAANEINVCWEEPRTGDEDDRRLVQKAVAETWEAASSARFVGWDECGSTRQGVRIKVSDEAPRTEAIGRFLDGRPHGMVLNFTFERWGRDCAARKDFCVYATAVHEFGHALGFTHEQNRKEASRRCQEKKQGSVGDYNVTRYDLRSIMNYCNPHWLGDGKLSELDIQAVAKFYR